MSTPQGKARAVPNRCCERVGDEADKESLLPGVKNLLGGGVLGRRVSVP